MNNHQPVIKPNPIRSRVSCPDCGYIYSNLETFPGISKRFNPEKPCPRCGVHYGEEDFWNEHEEKRMAQNHKIAQADLSGEEQE